MQYTVHIAYHLHLDFLFIFPSIKFINLIPCFLFGSALRDGSACACGLSVFIPIYDPKISAAGVTVLRPSGLHRFLSLVRHRKIRPVPPEYQFSGIIRPLQELPGRPAACPWPVPLWYGYNQEGILLPGL